MTKPKEFSKQTIVQHETRYQVDEQYPKGPQAGTGVLATGRVVWTEQEAKMAEEQDSVHAFAEGIGVVALQAESLRP